MSETKTEMTCAFCDKPKEEVAQLIARSETSLAICDECIGMSVDILLKHLKRSRLGSTEDDTESILDTLRWEAKLLRRGKGWAEERAMKAETALRMTRTCLREAIEFVEEIKYGDFLPDPGTTKPWREALGEPDESEGDDG